MICYNEVKMTKMEKLRMEKARNGWMRRAFGVLGLTVLGLMAIITCMICDGAISGKLTWSLIVASSIGLGWMCLAPVLGMGKRGLVISLAVLSGLIWPYLYILSRLIGEEKIWTIGAVMAVIGVIYLWSVLGIFMGLGKRKLQATGLVLLLLAPVSVLVNVVLAKMLNEEPVMDVWDVVSAVMIAAVAIVISMCDYIARRGKREQKL